MYDDAVEQLKTKGIIFSEGLSADEIKILEELISGPLPNSLKLFLSKAVPVKAPSGSYFPDWHKDPAKVIDEARDWVRRAFEFDIQENNYWHESLGDKPTGLDDAKKQAVDVISKWPVLIPIYGHRFMPSVFEGQDPPVLSVYQADDTVYYGYSLVEYLEKEFDIRIQIDRPQDPAKVPYWGDVFNL